jgi:hypothetical protein
MPKIMTKSHGTIHNGNQRWATIGHPKPPKLAHYMSTKSTSSLRDNYCDKHNWDVLDLKIGCQTVLRSKPRVPWWELAIKKDNRQSLPLEQEQGRDEEEEQVIYYAVTVEI